MAQEPETGRSAAGIARAGKRKWGYDPVQVDAFLERAHALYEADDMQLTQQDIQNVSFDQCKDGYVIAQVDAALARLERAVVDKQTEWEIAKFGRIAWKAQSEDLYRQLARHAGRQPRERFQAGESKSPSYDRKQVDRVVDQALDKVAAELGIDGMTLEDVRNLSLVDSSWVSNTIFTQRRGKRGYDERQVDFFLNSCVRLLSRLESYARVADYVGGQNEPAVEQAAPVAAEPVTSLFDEHTAYRQQPQQPVAESEPMAAPRSDESFDAVHRAEQAIFTPASASNTTESGERLWQSPTVMTTEPQSFAPQTPVSDAAPQDAGSSIGSRESAGNSALAALAHVAGASEQAAAGVASAVSIGEAAGVAGGMVASVADSAADSAAGATAAAASTAASDSAAYAMSSLSALAASVHHDEAVTAASEVPAGTQTERMVLPFAQQSATPGADMGESSLPPSVQPVVESQPAGEALADAAAAMFATQPVTSPFASAPVHATETSAPEANESKQDEVPQQDMAFPDMDQPVSSGFTFDIPDLSFPSLGEDPQEDSSAQ